MEIGKISRRRPRVVDEALRTWAENGKEMYKDL